LGLPHQVKKNCVPPLKKKYRISEQTGIFQMSQTTANITPENYEHKDLPNDGEFEELRTKECLEASGNY
jgi:hypothetical protein